MMTNLINLRALFEEEPRPQKFKDIHQELRAISNDEKARSVISFSRSDLGTDEVKEIIAAALDHKLSITYHPEQIVHGKFVYEQFYIFFTKPGQDWRIPAYISSRRILRDYRWSDGAEYLESYLLGYSEAEISQWIAYKRYTRASWTGLTVYLLMAEAKTERVRYLGMRCLEPNAAGADVIAFFSRSNLPIRTGATGIIPKGTTLLRVAVNRPFFERLFGPSSDWEDAEIISAPITTEIAKLMNPALESNFQIFHDGGWQ
jgi:hypothetical protein